MKMLPQLPPYQGYSIRKGGTRLTIPRRATHRGHSLLDQPRRVQRHDRVEAQQRRGGASHRAIMPLALRLPPQRRSCFFTRPFHRPAPDTPGQYLLRGIIQIGRQQGRRFEACVRVSDQSPAEGDRGFPGVIPHGGIRGDFHLTWPCTLPLINDQRRPWRPCIRHHRFQSRPTFPLEPGTAFGPRLPWGRGIIESRVKTPPRDHTGTGQGRDLVPQLQGGNTAVGDQGDRTSRQPTHHKSDPLPRPFRQGLMAATALRIDALGRTQDRQQGPRPDAIGPGERREHQTCKPRQATDCDNMRVGGAHGIAGDACGSDRLAPSAFDGVLQAQDDDAPGAEHGSQEPEQQPTGFERRPDRAMQDTMIRLKVGRCTASHKLENRRHCSFPRSQDGTGHKDFHVLPNRSGKDGGKDSNDTAEGDRQGEHGHPFSLKRTWVSLPINCDANCDKWTKSSSEVVRKGIVLWQQWSRP